MDGFFSMVFTGRAGSGFGMLTLTDGKVVGADVTGATYNGSYESDETTGETAFRLDVNLPAGVTPVQLNEPVARPTTIRIDDKVRSADILSEAVTPLSTSWGPINVIFKKIRGLD